jgi:glutaredoxin
MRWVALLTMLVVLPSGCSRSGSSRAGKGKAQKTPDLPAIQIARDRPLVFTYRAGDEFRTVQSLDEVPEAARGWVRVQDPAVPAPSAERVYVADLRQADKQGRFPYKILTRDEFLTGQASPKGGMGPAPPPGTTAFGQVILYTRPGCGACDAARAYLSQKKIPYVEKNVAADPAAAKELAAKADAKGFPKNVVPVMDVNGECIVGLDTQKLESLLRRQI